MVVFDIYSDMLISYQLSVVYKFIGGINVYVVFFENDVMLNSMVGGIVLGGNNEINLFNFVIENILYEVGVKYVLNS